MPGRVTIQFNEPLDGASVTPGAFPIAGGTVTAPPSSCSLGRAAETPPTGSAHPIVTGLNGLVTVADAPVDFSWGLPAPSAVRIGQVADGSARFPLYVYDTGAVLVDDSTPAPARRVNLPLTDNAYAGLNATGKQIVHNAILWAMGKPIGDTTRPSASIARSAGNVTITSSNGGTVQATDSLNPANWTDLGAAPQNVPASGTARFFRIRR